MIFLSMDRDEKLSRLRKLMEKAGIAAVIIPNSDPHSSEYLHPHWKVRNWFSGFTGSAGTLVVTKKESGLWTDFRYYIQAAAELSGSEIKLYKDGLIDTPSISDFLKEKLKEGDSIGLDGSLFPTSLYDSFKKDLDENNIYFIRDFDPAKTLWLDRPSRPNSKCFELDIKYCGESREEKLNRVRDVMRKRNLDYYIISSLADIAWLFNIRGNDVDYTPLVVSYALISLKDAKLFIESSKLSDSVVVNLKKSDIGIYDYDLIGDELQKLKEGTKIYYMPEFLNCYLSGIIPQEIKQIKGLDITAELKCIKNETELKNIRLAMERDGVALVKFFSKFENDRKERTFTEFSLAEDLRNARLSMPGCQDESFNPIIGFESNGALCHYSAKEESAKIIGNRGLLLIDSGGQYLEGTTDITRTISLGNPTVEEILHYTLVLQGHVRLAMAKFPEGTTGAQLDILARQPLWDNNLNYGHGTGHGVGFFLGVHEGPQSISPKGFKFCLKEGMITSNEPGLYIEGKHGIRIENLVYTQFYKNGLDTKFLSFENLTLYPYDISLIDRDILLEKEVLWINNYHKEVFERLSPYLSTSEVKWLEDKTREI